MGTPKFTQVMKASLLKPELTAELDKFRREITVLFLFDAYGRRTDNASGSTPAAPVDKPVPPGTTEESNSGATKMFSSSDLSGFFAAEPGAAEGGSSSIHSPGQDAKPEKNNPLPPQKGPSRDRK